MPDAGRPVLIPSGQSPNVRIRSVALLAAWILAAWIVGIAGCGRDLPDPWIEIDGRRVEVQVPRRYDASEPTPLVILLHGFGSNGKDHDEEFHLSSLVDEFGFLYLHPDGTRDCQGNRFWKANEVCCDFCGARVDDAGYLRALIARVAERYNVDERRIHLTGHSNGGFMAMRLACAYADTIASVAGVAGAGSSDPDDCAPSEPVHWLQVHGTADEIISYRGGILRGAAYPGAVETATQWAGIAGCSLHPEATAERLDLVEDLPGAETSVARYEEGCSEGGSATLWTIERGIHSPDFTRGFGREIISWLLSHPKPGGARNSPMD